jgi:hypothetical protein
MINKKNIPLYIALAIPVLMILLVAALIYLPGIGQKPRVNFLYMTGTYVYDYGYGSGGYQVSGGHLVYNMPTNPSNYVQSGDANFYLYNVSTGQSQEVTLAQAESYNLDPSNVSSDGYTVQQGNASGGDFLFGSPSGDYTDWFIKGHNRAFKLNLKLVGSEYSNFRFLGWTNN